MRQISERDRKIIGIMSSADTGSLSAITTQNPVTNSTDVQIRVGTKTVLTLDMDEFDSMTPHEILDKAGVKYK